MQTTVATQATQKVQVTVTITGDFEFAFADPQNGPCTFTKSEANNSNPVFWLMSHTGREMICHLLSVSLVTKVFVDIDEIDVVFCFDGSMRHKDPDFFVQSATHNVGIFVKMAAAEATESTD